MKLLVTGGAGFIGSNFIRHVLHLPGIELLVNLDALTYAGHLENIAEFEGRPRYVFEKGDICDKAFVLSVFAKYGVTHVLHFAAESHVDRSITGPGAFIQTNILGTFNLLEAARASWPAGSEHHRFHHVSTDEVYGSLGATGLFTEETPYSPNSPYSASKAASDHLVRSYFHTYRLPVVTTNCSNNYGPYQFPEKLIPVIIQNILSRKPIPVYGDGLNVRDWLYVQDHAEALWLILNRGRLGQTYNIGGNNEWANINIVSLICDLMDIHSPVPGVPARSLISFVTDRPGHDKRYAIDSSKIQSELGWKPAHTFDSGIRATIQWYLSHPDWVESVLKKH